MEPLNAPTLEKQLVAWIEYAVHREAGLPMMRDGKLVIRFELAKRTQDGVLPGKAQYWMSQGEFEHYVRGGSDALQALKNATEEQKAA